MALIKCPECGKDISEAAEICVHCGFPIKQHLDQKEERTCNEVIIKKDQHDDKRNISFIIIGVLALVLIMIFVGSYISKQAEIEKYRVEFSSEDEMKELLRSGRWWLTADGYSIGGYVSFGKTYFEYFDEDVQRSPLEYKLDYKNSSVFTTSGSFMYDVIYYRNHYYLRQNPKTEENKWILFKLSEYY